HKLHKSPDRKRITVRKAAWLAFPNSDEETKRKPPTADRVEGEQRKRGLSTPRLNE
ncbi:hypothetical protein P7K49_017087, partial [Saguinus oedipus]